MDTERSSRELGLLTRSRYKVVKHGNEWKIVPQESSFFEHSRLCSAKGERQARAMLAGFIAGYSTALREVKPPR